MVVTTGHVTYVQTSRHQVLGGGGQSAGDHQPTDDPAVLVGLDALLGQAQLAPSPDADAGEEHPGHRVGRWAGEHAGLLQVRELRDPGDGARAQAGGDPGPGVLTTVTSAAGRTVPLHHLAFAIAPG